MKRLLPLTALVALLAGCAAGARGTDTPAPGEPPREPPPAVTAAPLDLGGQKVLVLPVQRASGLSVGMDAATDEFVFALRERDTRTQWVMPDALRRALSRSPGYAPDPGSLPSDVYAHKQMGEPLAGIVRRYTALVDARVVVLPVSATFVPSAKGDRGHVRFQALVVDSRSGTVIWRGSADGDERVRAAGETSAIGDQGAVASAAAALAARMLRGDAP